MRGPRATTENNALTVASTSGVVLGGSARGEIFTASFGSVDLLYPSVCFSLYRNVNIDIEIYTLSLCVYIEETGASSALGHVWHVAIFTVLTKIWGWETYLEIHEFVYMSSQWLHC